MSEFARGIDRVKNNDVATSITVLRNGTVDWRRAGHRTGRTRHAHRGRSSVRDAHRRPPTAAQILASSVTIAGSGLVIALAGLSIFLVRRSSRARDEAEAKLRDNNLNLETTVDERTADLREANDEIQRFAYIVSHDLRSPLVNIMGFTSELEELRGDIFRRIAALARAQSAAPSAPENATDTAEPVLEGTDKQLSEDFSEALGFIKSSIAKMDRLISAILNLTREGRREFEPERIDTTRIDRRRSSRRWRIRPRRPQARSGSIRCRISSATAWRWSRSSPI